MAQTSKRVHFFEEVLVYHIPNRYQLTKREKRQLWFDPSSVLDITAKKSETIALFTLGKLVRDNDEYCMRGLYTRNQSRRRFETIQTCRETLLKLQDLQEQCGYKDQLEVAAIYIQLSQESRSEARNQGLKDELESQNLPVIPTESATLRLRPLIRSATVVPVSSPYINRRMQRL